MPKETFFNLPLVKRDKLIEASVNEFARKSCAEASINRIIQMAVIPRGSFYQYFSGKTDLFQYVLHHYGEQMESLILQELWRCGGKLLELPLAFYNSVLLNIQDKRSPLVLLPDILRRNADMEQTAMMPDAMQAVLEQADWSGLRVESPEERLCLLELLFSSVRRSLMEVFCGKLPPEESRKQLVIKTALIRCGAEESGSRI